MKKIIVGVVLFGLLVYGSYYATLYYFPNYVYSRFQDKVTEQRDEMSNRFSVIVAPDEDARLVVKPNPDFSYGSAFFDLDDGPLRLTGDMPDSTYWSVAIYQPNTINFYVKNDQQYDSNKLEVIITSSSLDQTATEQIISPTREGFILVRALIVDRTPEENQRIQKHLETLALTVVKD